VAGGAKVGDGVAEVLCVPDDECVEREAARAELVFLPFAIGLAEFALVAVEDDPGDGVTTLVTVEPDAGCPAQLLAFDPAEEMQCLGDATELSAVRLVRGATNRLGFALQLCALRLMGFAPDDLQSAPAQAVAFVARQVDACR